LITDVTILLPCHSFEDFPLYHSGEDAASLLASWSAMWHPALLNRTQKVPGWARCDDPPEDFAERLMILPTTSGCDLPSGYAVKVKQGGGILLRKLKTREELVAAALAALPVEDQTIEQVTQPVLVDEFYALGMAYLWTELLTRRMRYMSLLDEVRFQTDVAAAATASVRGDEATARSHLDGALDQLLQSRNHFYPVDCFLLDLTLVVLSVAGESLRAQLRTELPTTLVMSGETLDSIADKEPETLQLIREGLAAGRITLCGGCQTESEWPFAGAEVILSDLRAGEATWRKHLDQAPKFFGRRRAGLTPLLPNVLHGLGYRAALHVTLDEGRFPTGQRSKTGWQGLGSHSIDAIARVPLDAQDPAPLLSLPEKFGETMDYDQVASLAFVHWPGQVSPAYADLSRALRTIPVLGKFVTLQQYFDETSSPGEFQEFLPDQYRTPYLLQDVIRKTENPITRFQNGQRDELTRQTETSLCALAGTLSSVAATDQPLFDLSKGLSMKIISRDTSLLLVNPQNGRWRTGIELPREVPTPTVGGPILAVDGTSEPRRAVVEIPSLGFAWVAKGDAPPSEPKKTGGWGLFKKAPPAPSPIAVEFTLANEHLIVPMNRETGGIQAIRIPNKRGNRLSQQVGYRLGNAGTSDGWDDTPAYSRMVADELQITVASTVLGEFTSRGQLLDDNEQVLAKFTQVTRLWAGSSVVEIDLTLDPVTLPKADPWNSYYALRWAWSDELLELYRDVHETRHRTDAKRIESPRFVEIASEVERTTLLVNGLPYHQRTGYRMLDTLLITRGETARRFRIGIGVDLPNAAVAARQFAAPAPQYVAPETPASPSGWLLHIDARQVLVTALEPLQENGRVVGLHCRLLETGGLAGPVRISAVRPLIAAQRRLWNGEPLGELTITEGKADISLAAYDWTEVTVRWE
jgi:alpha-mannosidase